MVCKLRFLALAAGVIDELLQQWSSLYVEDKTSDLEDMAFLLRIGFSMIWDGRRTELSMLWTNEK